MNDDNDAKYSHLSEAQRRMLEDADRLEKLKEEMYPKDLEDFNHLEEMKKIWAETDKIAKINDEMYPKHLVDFQHWEEEQQRIYEHLDRYSYPKDIMSNAKPSEYYNLEDLNKFITSRNIEENKKYFNVISSDYYSNPTNISNDQFLSNLESLRNHYLSYPTTYTLQSLIDAENFVQTTISGNLSENLFQTLQANASIAHEFIEGPIHYQGDIYYWDKIKNEVIDYTNRFSDIKESLSIKDNKIIFEDKEIVSGEQIGTILSGLFLDASKIYKFPLDILSYAIKRIKSLNLDQILEGILVQFFLYIILSSLPFNLLQSNHSFLSKSRIYKQYKIHAEIIINEKSPQLKNEKRLRVVARHEINVRLKPKKNSLCINKLKGGSVVILLEKRKKWSFVKWDVNRTEYRGWVYNKYIEKVNLKDSQKKSNCSPLYYT